ncbi:YdcF family protein [Geothrix paludis]|uniref:YdcF family protein n=1 Tax=Geothrix paludis TaxID=2922722 RepID=UPI001FAC5491|nr:YdcF family protein [Geothrix paludis]
MAPDRPYTAPPRSTFLQKLGPGGLASFLLASGSAVLLLGLPVWWRMRRVLRGAGGDPVEPSDLILVLGRRLERDCPTKTFEARLAHAADLWRRGLAPRILVAGGLTGRARISEAEAGCTWLRSRGIPDEALRTEDQSQHTLENLFHVRETLRAESWRSLLLVSDGLHLARAGALARGLGLAVRCSPAPGCPPSPGSPAWWRRAALEAFFLHWYHTGLLYSRLIRSDRQLKRVT